MKTAIVISALVGGFCASSALALSNNYQSYVCQGAMGGQTSSGSKDGARVYGQAGGISATHFVGQGLTVDLAACGSRFWMSVGTDTWKGPGVPLGFATWTCNTTGLSDKKSYYLNLTIGNVVGTPNSDGSLHFLAAPGDTMGLMVQANGQSYWDTSTGAAMLGGGLACVPLK